MKERIVRLFLLVVIAIVFIGCATTDTDETARIQPDDSEKPATVEPEPAPDPVPEPEAEPQQEPTPQPEPEPAPEPDPQPEPEPQLETELQPEPGNIDVSEELYDQTFTEVELLIGELNEIISNRNFTAWQRYLTSDYRRTYSNPTVLEQRSQSGVLVRNNIVLRTLDDYFNYVVVPSRSNARLDDLVFIDENTVEAIMEVNDQRYILYLLKKLDDRWKIDTF